MSNKAPERIFATNLAGMGGKRMDNCKGGSCLGVLGMPGTDPASTVGVWASALAAARAGLGNPALACNPEWMRGTGVQVMS